MIAPRFGLVLTMCLGLAAPALAQSPVEIGGDRYLSDATVTSRDQAARDVVAMGASVTLSADVAEDVHAMGFDVEIDGAVGGDVVAAGATVSMDGPIAGDVTASAMTLRIGLNAEITGNVRLVAGTVRIDGPILGALVAAGGEVTLNAPIMGDVVLTAGSIEFGPEARIDGMLTYYAPAPLDVPLRVIGADRVQYQPATHPETWRDFRDEWADWERPAAIGPWAVVGGFLVNLGLFLLIGALFLTLAPNMVRSLRRRAEARPGMVILTGVIGLSILFGAVPVSAISIVGLPLVPLILLFTVVVWVLGYILGAYVLAMRVMRGLGGEESPGIGMRLLALALGVTLMALLNFIPVIGWMANFALVLLGVGAVTTRLFDSTLGRLEPELDQGLAPIDRTEP